MKRLPLLLATTVSAWGAASLTVTSRAIDSTGSIVTLGIGGVSGSLSPATGITGITVSLVGSSNSNPLKQVSATSSGSTVTVTLSTPAFSGETISVALSTNPTSNLTDTGGNTPAASQTGTATNSSTVNGVTFTTSSANLYLLGQWNDATAGGHNYKAPIGEGGHLTTVVTASDCYIQSNGNTVTLKVSVDGGAPSSISPAAGWSWSVLFRGLSYAAHMLDVHSINTVGTHLDRDATLRCSGASPTLATPTGYSTFLPINTAPFSTYSRLDGSPAIGTTHGYTNQATYAWAGSGVRFRAAITDLWLMGYDGNTPGAIALLQDGAQIASITPGGVIGYWPVWHLATGLDNAAHQYEILGIGVAQQNWGPYGLMLTGAGGLISETPALKATLSYYGDSIPG